ncbi:hypothetical protein HZS_394 [Henneguya salminicola]|nr:hypothetical protein HZS_394 [Henneguya salminicola]
MKAVTELRARALNSIRTELLRYNSFKNLKKGQKVYYNCSKYNVDKCPVRLKFCAENFKVKKEHVWNQKESSVTRITDDNITPKFGEKDSAYNIPSKTKIYSDIQDARNSMLFNSFQSIINLRLATKRTGYFFRRHPRSITYYIYMDKK